MNSWLKSAVIYLSILMIINVGYSLCIPGSTNVCKCSEYTSLKSYIHQAATDSGLASLLGQHNAEAAIEAIITQESQWKLDIGCANGNTDCGITQIHVSGGKVCWPDVSSSSFYNPSYSDLENMQTVFSKDHKAAIICGARILYGKLIILKNAGIGKDAVELFKFGIAAYNGGEGTILKTADCMKGKGVNPGDLTWDMVMKDLDNNKENSCLAKALEYYNIGVDPNGAYGGFCPGETNKYVCKAYVMKAYVNRVAGSYYTAWKSCAASEAGKKEEASTESGAPGSGTPAFNPFDDAADKAVVIKPTPLYNEKGFYITTIGKGMTGSVEDFPYSKDGKWFVPGAWVRKAIDVRKNPILYGDAVSGTDSNPYENIIPYSSFSCAMWGKYISSHSGSANGIVVSDEATYGYDTPSLQLSDAGKPLNGYPDLKVGDTIQIDGYQIQEINGKKYCILKLHGYEHPYHLSGTMSDGDSYIVPSMLFVITKSSTSEGTVNGQTPNSTEMPKPSSPSENSTCKRQGNKIVVNAKCNLWDAVSIAEDGDIISIQIPGVIELPYTLSINKKLTIEAPDKAPWMHVIDYSGTAISTNSDLTLKYVTVRGSPAVSGGNIITIGSMLNTTSQITAENIQINESWVVAFGNAIKANRAEISGSAIYGYGSGTGVAANELELSKSIIYHFGVCSISNDSIVRFSTFQDCAGIGLSSSKLKVSNSFFYNDGIGIHTGNSADNYAIGCVFSLNNIGIEGYAHTGSGDMESSFYGNLEDCTSISGCTDRCKHHERKWYKPWTWFSMKGYKVSECKLPEIISRIKKGETLRIDRDVTAVPIHSPYDERPFAIPLPHKATVESKNSKTVYVSPLSSGILSVGGKIKHIYLIRQNVYPLAANPPTRSLFESCKLVPLELEGNTKKIDFMGNGFSCSI